ncbi:hypothetical protein G5I_13109 [Acromyrmex echinatior]|uniref:Uncharacterized protein n=1 Tax=Acromyrmex echinatior TaxID=103372 RepID=F4X451_ACREC|nr:hypothetical protein G5I_13109 [Acromyrmex echinatior]
MSRPGKDPVQKCHSDPGATGSSCSPNKRISRRQVPCIPSSPNTRKCVLTLDGYNYVIEVVVGVRESLMLLVNSHILKMAAMLKPSTEYHRRPSRWALSNENNSVLWVPEIRL